ncbi:hypothetical protein FISHEDRAFT_57988 [Fistulina hepatica ATCC 64428]|uniref:BAH domain-containing protein n=1 Tax=Fistulina hepatica ATCC 64428 TaxID=1128425 RepID=A0A0D7AFY5_9AGAR|nr:hypothetical protein FISHEDRAFT_57988 [Fistulina hepatica ATCC 64428]
MSSRSRKRKTQKDSPQSDPLPDTALDPRCIPSDTECSGERHIFTKNDVYGAYRSYDALACINGVNRISILPENFVPGDRIEDHQYWIGKIRDIRLERDEGQITQEPSDTTRVWLNVQWYYSPSDVKQAFGSLSTSATPPDARSTKEYFQMSTTSLQLRASTDVSGCIYMMKRTSLNEYLQTSFINDVR